MSISNRFDLGYLFHGSARLAVEDARTVEGDARARLRRTAVRMMGHALTYYAAVTGDPAALQRTRTARTGTYFLLGAELSDVVSRARDELQRGLALATALAREAPLDASWMQVPLLRGRILLALRRPAEARAVGALAMQRSMRGSCPWSGTSRAPRMTGRPA